MDSSDDRIRHRRVRRTWFGVGTILLAAVGLWLFQKPVFQGNFGVVDAGRTYRSAQPQGRLRAWIENYQIATVLNLRGGSAANDWYRDEVQVTRAMSVDLVELPLNATRRPTRQELRRLVDVIERCRYPLLIHCKSGSDRTGMASALYLMIQRGESPQEAVRAFSIRYAHIAMLGPEHLHEPFDEYSAWLAARGLSHDVARFRSWLETEYRDSAPNVADANSNHDRPRAALQAESLRR